MTKTNTILFFDECVSKYLGAQVHSMANIRALYSSLGAIHLYFESCMPQILKCSGGSGRGIDEI